MKKVLPLLFGLSICAVPVFSWGGGDCPHSKKGVDQGTSVQEVEKPNASQED